MNRRTLLAVGLSALFLTTACTPEAPPETQLFEERPESDVQVYLPDGNHLSKSRDGRVTIVYWIDYQADNGMENWVKLQELSDMYAGRINLEVRNFPQETVHVNSRLAAQAAEAVHDWAPEYYPQFAQLLMENREEWMGLARAEALDAMVAYATEVRMDEQTFRDLTDSEKMSKIVSRDHGDGLALAVAASPAYYLNGKRLANGIDNYTLSHEIDSLLRQ